MVQRFVLVYLDENEYYCENQSCLVRVFLCSVGGVCPSCQEIGIRIGRFEGDVSGKKES